MLKFHDFGLRRMLGLALLGGVFLAACSSGGPVRSFAKGDELVFYDFEQGRTFEEGGYDTASLRVTDGLYRIRLTEGDSELWWGQWGDTYDDVVVEVTVNQLSDEGTNAFGVMCRMRGAVGQSLAGDSSVTLLATAVAETQDRDSDAEATAEATAEVTAEATVESTAEATAEAVEQEVDATPLDEPATSDPSERIGNGDGYLFLIRGNGTYSIMRSLGRKLTPLVDWASSDAINTGPDKNAIRAVCLGDYLAMYANGQFLAEVTDDTYAEGQVGLGASAATRLGVTVEFDNLIVSEARAG